MTTMSPSQPIDRTEATIEAQILELLRLHDLEQRARGCAGRFSAAVIDRVVADLRSRSAELAAGLDEDAAELAQRTEALGARREALLEEAETVRFRIEERELRRAIGAVEGEPDAGAQRDTERAAELDRALVELDVEREGLDTLIERLASLRPPDDVVLDAFDPFSALPGEVDEGAPLAGPDPFAVPQLVLGEGTSDEVVFVVPDEGALRVGRHRDNEVHLRNDSKISRFHARLMRDGAAVIVEDLRSANGTLVNGELVSERRLYGGEELLIGEIPLRFRLA